MTRTVLLTGGSGFVGRQIAQALAEKGLRLRFVARDPSRLALPAGDGAVTDIVQTPDLFAEPASWWQQACAGVDTVIHAAWYAEPGKYLHSPLNLDCLAGTLQLAKGAAAARVRRFVGIGTCFEYARSDQPLAYNAALLPQTPYAGAKVAAYMSLAQWLPAQQVEFSWCRLFYLYGEGEDIRRFVPYLRARLSAGEPAELSPGAQVLDFLDVTQAGRLIAETALGNTQGASNICSGQPIALRQLAERIADEYGRRDLLRFGARPASPSDPTHMVGIPGQTVIAPLSNG